VLNAIIMISNLNRWRRQPGIGLKDAVVCGARERMRPVLMTATVVVGGLVSATVLTLVLLPALYYLIEERAARRKRPEGPVAYVATEGES